ncbi:MAG: SDR family oxidoreductase [Jatrophihabitans sp.]|uniref:SDR family oxidoreductase n=1 Tax=Jatrophihabitans sp. TaxID=1932789 RepID=UPI003F7F3E21
MSPAPRRRRILITGASSGLGAEMARQFAAKGHDLALCARRVDNLERLRDEIGGGVSVTVHALDVNDHDAVFTVFRAAAEAHGGGLDRVIVNAGLGKGAPIGTGRFDANRETAMTNFVAALAQCEAAMELFRGAGDGHLVVISSMSAMRGLPRALTTYAATKAGIAALAEGIRADVLGTPIRVTTIYPGYIRSEMNDQVAQSTPLMVSTEVGVRSIVGAVEREVAEAETPAWPWRPLGVVMRHAPLQVIRRLA